MPESPDPALRDAVYARARRALSAHVVTAGLVTLAELLGHDEIDRVAETVTDAVWSVFREQAG